VLVAGKRPYLLDRIISPTMLMRASSRLTSFMRYGPLSRQSGMVIPISVSAANVHGTLDGLGGWPGVQL
jgi:hypothetical protein